ncbi:hypothetical protein [Actinomadura verrucosospora]|uniref:Uncharacterized protein n=1 Tax=Actinomadura verrucosospora TaxID=46165 RepID=A0A7D4ABZ9_ACTVE|nr:hypothetical protein [Actinomadura verrucosospora]QKG27305.1 hypothetical protein ACTIVE_8960 [Actinomadura verrucosospora]
MEVGKWIVFAFLTGVIVVGFKTRSLKTWEFISCGAFMLLLDGLVFHGQISTWLGHLGSNVKGAAGHAALGHAVSGMAVIGAPTMSERARRFAAAMWARRPGLDDCGISLAVAVLAHLWLGAPWPVAAASVVLVLIAFPAISVITAPQPRTHAPTKPDPDAPAALADKPGPAGAGDEPAGTGPQVDAQAGPVCPVCGDPATTWDNPTGDDVGQDAPEMWRCTAGHSFVLTPAGHVRGLTRKESEET